MSGKPAPRPSLPEERLAVASMALLLGITMVNVVVRYATDESVAWTEEVSVFLMVVLTLSGASAVARRDSHIRIELFLNQRTADGAETPRRGLKLFGALATSLTFMLLAALFALWVFDQFRYNETSMGLGIPLWWYGLIVAPLCLAISARAFGVFLRAFRNTPDATDNPEAVVASAKGRE